jgi:hypothetical protein
MLICRSEGRDASKTQMCSAARKDHTVSDGTTKMPCIGQPVKTMSRRCVLEVGATGLMLALQRLRGVPLTTDKLRGNLSIGDKLVIIDGIGTGRISPATRLHVRPDS